ncbi:hypothetical protein HERIO_2124 [Hepatospora eriocheir]|uniref:Uncharacterized protein n=1 Tax=Hepatospora eriocheir TaxID=1081669 RepID=A0A1X0Q828_9MICR|nr:hypothetical protein HERIO_2124 [Hepatospora eriocheir]
MAVIRTLENTFKYLAESALQKSSKSLMFFHDKSDASKQLKNILIRLDHLSNEYNEKYNEIPTELVKGDNNTFLFNKLSKKYNYNENINLKNDTKFKCDELAEIINNLIDNGQIQDLNKSTIDLINTVVQSRNFNLN